MKIAICTGGGDCPGLNAVIRSVTLHAVLNHKMEVTGVMQSINGLMSDPPTIRKLDLESVTGILERGGTILGTSNNGSPFKDPVAGPKALAMALKNWQKLGLDGLIVVGGDGTQRMALNLHSAGMPILGIPKTIDNDYSPTDLSVGFTTAVEVAAAAIERLHSSAESHSRAMVIEVMGRDAGFIALHAGIAAGANVILLPEIPYNFEAIVKATEERKARGRNFSIIVVAEGAFEQGKAAIFRSSATGTFNLGGVADEVAKQLHARVGLDARVTVLGHVQRGGTPGAVDRILATTFGVHAVDLAAKRQWGRVVTWRGGKVGNIGYEDIKEGTRAIAANDQFLHAAESIGICLGR
ncbi:MAG: ATP-dependent 6-phosphofructokinase [Proteobacteria bacterium]|nr:ATP-dependent 6-phosphofructokinase [Pseudomonadota bacterium]